MAQISNNPLDGARVYVSTYAKYNHSSLEGAWIKLDLYKNKSEFMAACKKLHKDERDPEFMFQDWENVPSWMISESWIDEEVWNQKPEEPQKKEEIRAMLEKAMTDKSDIDYYTKHTESIVEVDGRFFDIEKSTIETRFCHPDEPEEAVKKWWEAVRTYEYFKNENISGLDNMIKKLHEANIGDSRWTKTVIWQRGNGLWDFAIDADIEYRDSWVKRQNPILMDEKTRDALLKGYKTARARFEKRLETWWKKYGADKLHCWTYWADR